jgi:hypothetical protein
MNQKLKLNDVVLEKFMKDFFGYGTRQQRERPMKI